MLQTNSNTRKFIYKRGISICIPAYNEEVTIRDVVINTAEIIKKVSLPAEILVLDDCSTDSTWDFLTELSENVEMMRIRRHEVNKGIAITFNELYSWSQYEFVFLYPGDGQWDISILLDMLALTDQYDLIIAKRNHKQYNYYRKLVSWLFNILPVLLFQTKTYDAGSVKLVRREIYNISTISKGVFVEAERIIRSKFKGYGIGYINVIHYPRNTGEGSGAKFALIKEAITDMINCWIDIVIFRNL